MPRISFDMAEEIHPATKLSLRGEALLRQVQETRRPIVLTQGEREQPFWWMSPVFSPLIEELDLLRDVHRGLADVGAGRVVSQEEARARLMARYS